MTWINHLSRKGTVWGIGFLVVVSLIFCLPLFDNPTNWGEQDWDQHLLLRGVPYRTILEYRQIPLWNPYQCGGNVLLANPQSGFLSPLFLLELIFGVIIGVKIEIWLHLLIGMLGMYLIATRLYRLTPIAALFPPVIYMCSGMYAFHLAAGHTTFMAFAYFPYVYYFLVKGFSALRYAIICGVVLALIIFEGGTYAITHAALFATLISVLTAIRKRTPRPLGVLTLAALTGILLSACKLLPILEMLQHYPRQMTSVDFLTLRIVLLALFLPDQGLTLNTAGLIWGWWEYASYIGVFAFLLGLLGALIHLRKIWPLVLSGLFFFGLSWGNLGSYSLWNLLHRLPVFRAQHVPSRFLHGLVFVLAIGAGLLLSDIERSSLFSPRLRWLRILLPLVSLLIISFELTNVNSGVFREAFPYPAPHIRRREEFQLIWGHHHGTYSVFLANRGSVDCYEPLHVDVAATPASSAAYRGETYLLGTGSAQIQDWSPNAVTIAVQGTGTLCLNQNYAFGWRVRPNKMVKAVDGVVCTDVGPNDRQVTFFYLPGSFLIGTVISVISGIGSLFLWRRLTQRK